MRRLVELSLSALLLVVPFWSAFATEAVDYEREIKPLLLHKCAACHGAIRQTASLRLDAAELIRAGGESGPAIRPGDGAGSLLLERVASPDADLRMPPEGEGEPLTDAQIELVKRWIDLGAESPAGEPIPADPSEYWSYQPPRRPPVPEVADPAWVRNPIDAFVAAKRESLRLSPRAEASKETWLRRVFLDLIGLPPTADELNAFVRDDSSLAYEQVVDDLLQRAEYGERWGRHWMDVWRYSDWYGSRGGNEIRYGQRHLWRWRDWIVESLNADKPYDQMVIEMLAGDEVAPADPDVLRATGYLGRNWYKFDRNVWMFDTVEYTSQALLGLTLRCARCHDHKYDPITQLDYYRFRAFFEPYQVRVDPLAFGTAEEKDATLGMVLSDGVARVFDQELEAPTYLFRRGDDRSPDRDQPLTPGVPAALGNAELEIRPIELPSEGYLPSLRPKFVEGLLARAASDLQAAQQRLREAQAAAEKVKLAAAELAAGQAADSAAAGPPAEPEQPHLQDRFETRSPRWQVVSGAWSWEEGKLAERSVGNFLTVVASENHPRDFTARVKYRTLAAGDYRSVGFSFDYVDQGHSQDVYTSANNTAPSIQAFHRRDGKQEYPQAGIVKTPVAVDQVIEVEITARGQKLSIRLNGEPKLDYVMPVARRDGRFALWVHNGAAEFLEVELRALLPTAIDLQRQVVEAEEQLRLAEYGERIAVAEVASVAARVAAEQVKYQGGTESSIAEAGAAAVAAERQLDVIRAEQAVFQAESFRKSLDAAPLAASPNVEAKPVDEPAAANPPAGSEAAIKQADERLAKAREGLATATQKLEQREGPYTPLGPSFPTTSTGRRTALARWIVHPENPRTARVAVNQIWLRHFGQALVPTVANFGLNGQQPSHPELLDWLALELIENRWQMKPLHRQIVLSSTYRQSSALGAADDAVAAAAIDPENRYLWRMNSRRMEAEVVRDSVLFVAGTLDPTRGGPEISETQDQTVLRRSLYFRNTPNEKVPFLNTFDIANPNECYERHQSVVPQQALALLNSALAIDQSRVLAERLRESSGDGDDEQARTRFIVAAWQTILTRSPTPQELESCLAFLSENSAAGDDSEAAKFPAGKQAFRRAPTADPTRRARENLIQVLFSHNDFVTIR